MNHARLMCCLMVAFAVQFQTLLAADDLPIREISIVNFPDRKFETIQAALDAAEDHASIKIGEGRYDERLKITKPVTLIGAGPLKSIIGPTRKVREPMLRSFHQLAKRVNENPNLAPADAQASLKKAIDFQQTLSEPIVQIDGAQGVDLQSLSVTSPGSIGPNDGLWSCGAIQVTNGSLRMSDDAIVGSLGSGVIAIGKSTVEIHDSLIAACWNCGVEIRGGQNARLTMFNCDVRNCYYTGISCGSCEIQGCRVSGAGWHGIACNGVDAKIKQNAIFENAGTAIYSASHLGLVQHNVFYKNSIASHNANGRIEENLFLNTKEASVYLNGVTRPEVVGNLFANAARAVVLVTDADQSPGSSPFGDWRMTNNLFCQIEKPIVNCVRPQRKLGKPQIGPLAENEQPLELPIEWQNRAVTLQVQLDSDRRIEVGTDVSAVNWNLAEISNISLNSRWPLTEEERAIIPDGDTRESSKWKMTPR